MEFVKVHGTGNDFVLLPDLEDTWTLEEGFARALCDRHTGVGADGAIRLGAPRRGDGDVADVFMDYRNADGSLSEMCGNGVRCVAKYVADRGIVKGEVVRVDTRGGVKVVEVTRRHVDGTVAEVRVDMGCPEPTGSVTVDVSPERVLASMPALAGLGSIVTAEHHTVELTTLSMGNPHAVVRVEDVAGAPVAAWGPLIATDPAFPQGTNVEFVAPRNRRRVEGRIWERGVGETRASGTGASAMAMAAHLWGATDRDVVVALPGGELAVGWTGDTLYVSGPAEEVATGRLDESWLRRARGAGR